MLIEASWTSADGFEVPLYTVGAITVNGITSVLERGRTGLDMPPVSIESFDLLGIPGEYRSGVKVQPRESSLPLMVAASTVDELDAHWSRLMRAFDPTVGVGMLRMLSDDVDRVLMASCVGGLEGNDSRDSDGVIWRRAVLKLRAHDPFWLDGIERTVTFTSEGATPFFPFAFDGVPRLNPDATFGTYYPPMIGDVPSYPIWRINGPFTSLEVSNSAGEAFRYGRELPEGATLYLNFDPLAPSATISVPSPEYNDLAVDVWDGIIWPSELWSIRPDAPNVMVALSGSTPASSAVLVWRPRWKSWRSKQEA